MKVQRDLRGDAEKERRRGERHINIPNEKKMNREREREDRNGG